MMGTFRGYHISTFCVCLEMGHETDPSLLLPPPLSAPPSASVPSRYLQCYLTSGWWTILLISFYFSAMGWMRVEGAYRGVDPISLNAPPPRRARQAPGVG